MQKSHKREGRCSTEQQATKWSLVAIAPSSDIHLLTKGNHRNVGRQRLRAHSILDFGNATLDQTTTSRLTT